MSRYENNLVVLGAGSGGLIAALIAATVNAKVTLIEKGRMGGDCLNTGCVPSKTLIRSAKVAHEMRNADQYGLSAVEPQVDFARVMERVQAAIRTIEPKDSMARYTELGVECVAGAGELEDPHHVRVGDRVVSTRSIVLATGASPFVPPIPGLTAAQPLTSDTLWDLRTLPGRLLVMGGGPIGCELAQSFQRLGSQVTLIDMETRLLPREDVEVGEFMAQALRAEGVDVRLGHRATEVRGQTLIADTDDDVVEIGFDRVLVAVGRRAHSEGMGFEKVGIETAANGTIVVDDYLRTACPNIFACGDATGPYQFTHMASHQAWYAAVNALFGRFKKFRVDYSVVPWCTFTDPEIARVGLSEAEAAEQGIAVEVIRYDLDDLDRSIADGNTRGWVKVLVKPGSDRILGACIVGSSAGELIGEFVSAMTHGLGLKKIMSTIHIYPTLLEANKFAASSWRKTHAPTGLLKAVGVLHRWLR
jgi:pyruvate/2-oxoglutarate dehydrogenase complex dihydrolipoamide dehydrogenase (E3) component